MKPTFSSMDPCVERVDGTARIPSVFCWTKMGTEAGQPLSVILARKEAERQLGQGVFFWGIGNALGAKFWDFVDRVPKPTVLFSNLKSRAKIIDVSPRRVVAWTAFYDRCGNKRPMPAFAFVTSRAETRMRISQPRFALVCKSSRHLGAGTDIEPLLSQRVVNYRSRMRVAPSQVTAIVELACGGNQAGRSYNVALAAELTEPFYVRLADPVEVSNKMLAEMNRIPLSEDFSAQKWRDYLDERFEYRKSPPVQFDLALADCEPSTGAGMGMPEAADSASVG